MVSDTAGKQQCQYECVSPYHLQMQSILRATWADFICKWKHSRHWPCQKALSKSECLWYPYVALSAGGSTYLFQSFSQMFKIMWEAFRDSCATVLFWTTLPQHRPFENIPESNWDVREYSQRLSHELKRTGFSHECSLQIYVHMRTPLTLQS